MAKRKIQETDIYKLKQVSNPQISPDGKTIAYSFHYIDQNNDYITEMCLIENSSGKCVKQFSNGKNNKSQKWCPNGKNLAFISDKTGIDQIWFLKEGSDKAEQLTTMKNGVTSLDWSSDGKRLVFLSKVSKNENYLDLIREKNNEEQKKEKEEKINEIKVINKKFYKLDGVGFFDDRISQVWVVDLETKKCIQITQGDCSHQFPVWSNTENKIAYVKNISQDSLEYHPLKSELWIYDCQLKESRCLINGDMAIMCPSFSPDGKKIAYFSHNIEFGEASFYKLWVYDLETEEKKCMTSSVDMALGNWGLNDVSSLSIMSQPVWDIDGKTLFFSGSSRGNVEIYRISHGKDFEKIVAGNRQIGQFSMDAKSKFLVFNFSSTQIPGDISIFDLNKKKETRLTEINKELLEDLVLSKPDTFQIRSENGWDVQGWIMKPADFKKGIKYPAILEIHGGPHLMYANSFFFEFQYLAAAGYIVAYSNPCGSMGYGQVFADANRGDYGGVDYQDLMNVTDYIAGLDYIDEKRLGLTGGSYGVYMTNWILTHTHRFKAAVTQRSISNLFTHAGVSDDGMFTAFLEQKVTIKNMEELYKRSPITYIEQVETPLLIMHSENDYRCPLEQAEQMYIHLKFRERITEMIIYPNSSHGLSRNGYPPFRVDRLRKIAGWFDKFN